jgi:DNA-binding MarR family transcriptional regulator
MTQSQNTIQRNKIIQYLTEAILGAAASLNATEAQICKEIGLTPEHWAALSAIKRMPRSLSLSQLARQLKHRRQSTHTLALNMERAGWIRLLPNPDERRLVQMELTADGHRVLGIAEARRNAWLITMTYDLEESDLNALLSRMQALRHRIVRAGTYV